MRTVRVLQSCLLKLRDLFCTSILDFSTDLQLLSSLNGTATCRCYLHPEPTHTGATQQRMVSQAMSDLNTVYASLRGMLFTVLHRLPEVALAIIVFFIFQITSTWVRGAIQRITGKKSSHHNLGLVLGRLAQGAMILSGALVALIIAIPSSSLGSWLNHLESAALRSASPSAISCRTSSPASSSSSPSLSVLVIRSLFPALKASSRTSKPAPHFTHRCL